MSVDPVISARGISKRFPLPPMRRRGLRRSAMSHRTVLEDIDLTVRSGDSLAVLGSNGAGKSTLLKIIAGVQRPSRGEVAVRGTLGALIELGAGFHPEHNAIDNLRAGATLMGVQEPLVDTVIEEALTFSGIAEHARKPLKHYSSGMIVRLGFSLVAAVRPDVLLTDEVLAVGDESFQKKCIEWLENYLANGGTLLLVSHNLYHVQKLCTRAAWLHDGRIRAEGDTFKVVQQYLAHHEASVQPDSDQDDTGNGLHGLDLHPDCATDGVVVPGTRARVVIDAEPGLEFVVRLRRLSGELLWESGTETTAGSLSINLPTERLLPGRYLVEAARPRSPGGLKRLFRVDGATRKFGSIDLEHHWD